MVTLGLTVDEISQLLLTVDDLTGKDAETLRDLPELIVRRCKQQLWSPMMPMPSRRG